MTDRKLIRDKFDTLIIFQLIYEEKVPPMGGFGGFLYHCLHHWVLDYWSDKTKHLKALPWTLGTLFFLHVLKNDMD